MHCCTTNPCMHIDIYTHARLLCTLWGFVDVDSGKWNSVLACIGTMKRNSIICPSIHCHAVSVRVLYFGRTSKRRECRSEFLLFFYFSMFINSLCRIFLFLSLDFFRFSFTRAYTHSLEMHICDYTRSDSTRQINNSHERLDRIWNFEWIKHYSAKNTRIVCWMLKMRIWQSTDILYTIIISIWIIRGYFFPRSMAMNQLWCVCAVCVWVRVNVDLSVIAICFKIFL